MSCYQLNVSYVEHHQLLFKPMTDSLYRLAALEQPPLPLFRSPAHTVLLTQASLSTSTSSLTRTLVSIGLVLSIFLTETDEYNLTPNLRSPWPFPVRNNFTDSGGDSLSYHCHVEYRWTAFRSTDSMCGRWWRWWWWWFKLHIKNFYCHFQAFDYYHDDIQGIHHVDSCWQHADSLRSIAYSSISCLARTLMIIVIFSKVNAVARAGRGRLSAHPAHVRPRAYMYVDRFPFYLSTQLTIFLGRTFSTLNAFHLKISAHVF